MFNKQDVNAYLIHIFYDGEINIIHTSSSKKVHLFSPMKAI